MLEGNFFDIQTFAASQASESEQQVRAVTILNLQHPVFGGHFPGNPVVPGVCQVQMVRELVAKALEIPVKLYESDNIKFLSMINPVENPSIEFDIRIRPADKNQYVVHALIGSASSVFLKFKGKFQGEE